MLTKIDWAIQRPCTSIKKIQFIGNEWILEPYSGNKKTYIQAIILIYNPFFMLIEFKNKRQKKCIVLFNDQLTNNQLRLLHLKTHQK